MSCWRPYCAVGVPADASTVVGKSPTISGIFIVAGLPSAVDAVMFLLFLVLLLLASFPCRCRLHCFCRHPCFGWWPYCVCGPVVAFIPAVACVPAVTFIQSVAGILAVAGVLLVLMVSCCWSLCNCWGSWCCWEFLLFLSNMLLLASCCCWHPVITGFSAVEGVLAVASIPAYPGVPILAGCFTYWTVKCTLRHIWLSDYRNIEYRIGEFKNLSDIGLSSQSIGLSDIGLRINNRLPTSDWKKQIT